MKKVTVAALAHQRDRFAVIIQRVTPPPSEDRATLELLTAVTADAFEREGRQHARAGGPALF